MASADEDERGAGSAVPVTSALASAVIIAVFIQHGVLRRSKFMLFGCIPMEKYTFCLLSQRRVDPMPSSAV